MKKNVLLLILIALVFSLHSYAQFDEVGFRADTNLISALEVRCFGYAVTAGDTTFFDNSETDDYIFTWNFDGEIFTDTLPQVWYRYDSPGEKTITFTVEDRTSGATYTSGPKTINFSVALEIPNVFTPNGDNQNDYFIVRYDGITPFEISIYSRSGILVYNTEAPVIVWNGRNASGLDVSEGTYFYILKALDGSLPPMKGFVQLYR